MLLAMIEVFVHACFYVISSVSAIGLKHHCFLTIFNVVLETIDFFRIPDTLIFRFDMSLYFANADLFVSSMKKQIALRHKECLSPSYSAIDSNHHSKSPTIAGLKFVVLDAEPFNFIDHSGIIALSTVLQHCKASQIELLISVCGLEIVEKFEREGFVDKIGLENLFPSVHDAVLYIEDVFLNRGQATSMNKDFVQLQKENDLKEIDASEIHSV